MSGLKKEEPSLKNYQLDISYRVVLLHGGLDLTALKISNTSIRADVLTRERAACVSRYAMLKGEGRPQARNRFKKIRSRSTLHSSSAGP